MANEGMKHEAKPINNVSSSFSASKNNNNTASHVASENNIKNVPSDSLPNNKVETYSANQNPSNSTKIEHDGGLNVGKDADYKDNLGINADNSLDTKDEASKVLDADNNNNNGVLETDKDKNNSNSNNKSSINTGNAVGDALAGGTNLALAIKTGKTGGPVTNSSAFKKFAGTLGRTAQDTRFERFLNNSNAGEVLNNAANTVSDFKSGNIEAAWKNVGKTLKSFNWEEFFELYGKYVLIALVAPLFIFVLPFFVAYESSTSNGVSDTLSSYSVGSKSPTVSTIDGNYTVKPSVNGIYNDSTPSTETPNENGFISALPKGTFIITSSFGNRVHPISGVIKFHNGLDLGAGEGTNIYSVLAGEVIYTGYEEGGAGNYIQICSDNGYCIVYMHMVQPTAYSPGDRVSQGTVVGYVGTTGGSTGNHLHITVCNGRYHGSKDNCVDPTSVYSY